MVASCHPPEYAANSLAFRACLRREKLALRQALESGEHDRLSAAIDRHLASELASCPPRLISIYWPIRREFDPRPLASRLIAHGWTVCMPVVVATDAPMVFRLWTPDATMLAGPHGIPVPATDTPSPSPDIVLLPLVAFDTDGYRLGYGGGYFDRTLAAMVPLPTTIGVGFESACVPSIQPHAHDRRLRLIVTEMGFRRFGNLPPLHPG